MLDSFKHELIKILPTNDITKAYVIIIIFLHYLIDMKQYVIAQICRIKMISRQYNFKNSDMDPISQTGYVNQYLLRNCIIILEPKIMLYLDSIRIVNNGSI